MVLKRRSGTAAVTFVATSTIEPLGEVLNATAFAVVSILKQTSVNGVRNLALMARVGIVRIFVRPCIKLQTLKSNVRTSVT